MPSNKEIVFLETLAFKASGVFFEFERPLFLASFSHASPYPSPSKRIRLESLIYSLRTLNIASSFFIFFSDLKRSTLALNSLNCFATIVFRTVIGFRSEERRVGKECRSRLSPYH